MYERSKLFLTFYIAGFTYWDGAYVLQQLQTGERLEMRVEPNNPYDPIAVALYYRDAKLGYVPRVCNQQLSDLLYFGNNIFEAVITQINPEAHPEEQVCASIHIKDARGDIHKDIRAVA